jgi:hypothetical protein
VFIIVPEEYRLPDYGAYFFMKPMHVFIRPVLFVLALVTIIVSPVMAAGHWDIMNVEKEFANSPGTGLYTSIVIDKNDVPHVAWVNEHLHRVKYGVYDKNKWNIELVGPIDNPSIGRTYYTFTTSIDLDPQGNPAISYAGTEGHLYFAHRETNGTWIIKDIAGSNTLKHQWSSLKYDHTGRPHIAFTTKTYVSDVPYASHLSWAWQKDDKIWQVDTIDNPTEDAGYEPSLAFDSQNRATVAYRTGFGYGSSNELEHLKVARQDYNGSWEIITPENSCKKKEKCGVRPSLALDSKGNANIAHSFADFDSNLTNAYIPKDSAIQYSVLNRPYTTMSTDNHIFWWENGVDYTDLGHAWVSLALDPSDNRHFSYYDPNEKNLKYTYNSNKIDNTKTVDGNGDVGRCNAIALDSHNNPWIIYRDDTNNVVKVAHWVPE